MIERDDEMTRDEVQAIRDRGRVIVMTVAEARALFDAVPDAEEFEPLAEAIDSLQGEVGTNQAEASYLVIKIEGKA